MHQTKVKTVAAKSQLSIRAAVMNCLARCSDSNAPVVCLDEFLEKLSAMGWNVIEVQAVETAVIDLMAKVKKTHSP
jgi:hypothetical protein